MNEFSIFGTQFTASAVIVLIGNVLEHWFPKLVTAAPTAKRIVAWLIAAFAAIGIHESFTASTGTLIITGLTVGGIIHAIWHWIQSVALQEFVHRSTK